MKQHPNNVNANFHYLLIKECLNQIKGNQQQLHDLIKQCIDQENTLELSKDSLEEQKKVYAYLSQRIKDTEWGANIMRKMKEKILEKAKQLYQFGSQRNYFLIQTFRETTNPPIVNSKPQDCYNLLALYKKCINKELRRLIWQKTFITETNKQNFFVYDHKISPYNIIDQLTISINRLALQNNIKLKQNQKDIGMRLLDYVVKKWNRIPNRSQQYLALAVIQLFSHYTPTKMYEIGAIYIGLIQMAQYYFQPDIQERVANIYTAFQLVDPETYQLIKKSYSQANDQKKLQSQLNQFYQHFRMTMTCSFLPLAGSQYLIDQLIIKKRNKFDSYVLFCIMLMIMSDDLQEFKTARLSLSEIINPERTKKTIKLEDIIDAFKVIYENVPPYHVGDNLPEKNKLLEQLLRYDALENNKNEGNTIEKMPISNEQLSNFVKEDKRQILRLGNSSKK